MHVFGFYPTLCHARYLLELESSGKLPCSSRRLRVTQRVSALLIEDNLRACLVLLVPVPDC